MLISDKILAGSGSSVSLFFFRVACTGRAVVGHVWKTTHFAVCGIPRSKHICVPALCHCTVFPSFVRLQVGCSFKVLMNWPFKSAVPRVSEVSSVASTIDC